MTEAERQRRSDQLLTSRFRSLNAIDASMDERLEQLDPDNLSPREALQTLYELQAKLRQSLHS